MVVARPEEDVSIGAGRVHARLSMPDGCRALVLLGNAGGAETPRNSAIGQILGLAGFGILTLAFPIDSGAIPRQAVTDVGNLAPGNLAASLVQALDWITKRTDLSGLPRGLILSGIGATAALQVDGLRPGRIDAIVSCGGRLDLVGDEELTRVSAPTLLVVGGCDKTLEQINRRALSRMTCVRRLEILPHVRHELEQPGALESVAYLASDWFCHELRPWRIH